LRKSIVVVVLGFSLAASADAQVQDTIANRSPFFTGRDALILGGFAVGTVAMAPLDRHFAEILQNPTAQENRFLRGSARAFKLFGMPGSIVAGVGLYIVGTLDNQRRMQDLGLHSAESILLSTVVDGGIKVLAGRSRPYVNIENPHGFQLGRGLSGYDYQSFPSGHTTAAFAFAASVSRETQMWWPRSRWYVGTLMYGGATVVGLSRMYNNVHWASDILGGAAIGTLIGLKVVTYHHCHPDNAIDRALLRKSNQRLPTLIPLANLRFR
jgi:membrane-associated phospholipid phosphatase